MVRIRHDYIEVMNVIPLSQRMAKMFFHHIAMFFECSRNVIGHGDANVSFRSDGAPTPPHPVTMTTITMTTKKTNFLAAFYLRWLPHCCFLFLGQWSPAATPAAYYWGGLPFWTSSARFDVWTLIRRKKISLKAWFADKTQSIFCGSVFMEHIYRNKGSALRASLNSIHACYGNTLHNKSQLC